MARTNRLAHASQDHTAMVEDIKQLGGIVAMAPICRPKLFQRGEFGAGDDPCQRLPDPGLLTTIEPDRDRVEWAVVSVFQVVTDGRDFRVRVDGHNIKFLQE
jgi:hypothetical protein